MTCRARAGRMPTTVMVTALALALASATATAQEVRSSWPLQPPADAPGAQRLQEADRLLHDADDTEANLLAAIQAYSEAVKLGLPDRVAARALGHRGLAYLRLGDHQKDDARKLRLYELGTRSADEGLKRDPNSADAWFYRGATLGRWAETKGVLKALFLLDDVRGAFERALKSDPSHADAVLALGKVDEALPGFAGGSTERAESRFRAALKLDPEFSRAALDLAELLADDGRKDEARALCEAVLQQKKPSRPGEWRKFDVPRARRLLKALGG